MEVISLYNCKTVENRELENFPVEIRLDVGRFVEVLPFQGDTDELAEQGKRIMLSIYPKRGVIFIKEVPKGELNSGWVLGVIKE